MINVGTYGTFLQVSMHYLKEEEAQKKFTFASDSEILLKKKESQQTNDKLEEDNFNIIEEEISFYTPSGSNNVFQPTKKRFLED